MDIIELFQLNGLRWKISARGVRSIGTFKSYEAAWEAADRWKLSQYPGKTEGKPESFRLASEAAGFEVVTVHPKWFAWAHPATGIRSIEVFETKHEAWKGCFHWHNGREPE